MDVPKISLRRRSRALAVAGGALALGLCLIAPAEASSGEIIEASANGSLSTIAGSVTWTGCVNAVPPPPPGLVGPGETPPAPSPPYCAWAPYLTLGPGKSAADCTSADRRLASLGAGVSLLWSEASRSDLGSTAFSLSSVPLNSEANRLLCLSVLETAQTGKTLPCMPPGPPLPPGWHCPYANQTYVRILAAAPLPTPPVQPTAGTSTAPIGTAATVVHAPRRCRSAKAGFTPSRRPRCRRPKKHHRTTRS
jgi:hypothetical protein